MVGFKAGIRPIGPAIGWPLSLATGLLVSNVCGIFGRRMAVYVRQDTSMDGLGPAVNGAALTEAAAVKLPEGPTASLRKLRLHSDLFYLLENSTPDKDIPMLARGLTPNYYSHVFWDNDNWDFPVMLLLHPDRARSLVMFRYRTLAAAEERARKSSDWVTRRMKGFLKLPFNVRSETAENNTLYILAVSGGFLQDFLYGFSGLRFGNDGMVPTYPPLLSSSLKSITLRGIHVTNHIYDFKISREASGKAHLEKAPVS
jgi:hypothetical protein